MTPRADTFFKIRYGYLRICDGNECAASILDIVEYRARRLPPGTPVGMSITFLARALFGVYSKNTIKKALTKLVDRGFLRAHRPNRRTEARQYTFESGAIVSAIGEYFPEGDRGSNVDRKGGSKTAASWVKSDLPGGSDLTNTHITFENAAEEYDDGPLPELQKFPSSEVQIMRDHLEGYTEGHLGAASDKDVLYCLKAGNGATAAQIGAHLYGLWKRGQRVGHKNGPRSYNWFPRVISAHFNPGRNDAIRPRQSSAPQPEVADQASANEFADAIRILAEKRSWR